MRNCAVTLESELTEEERSSLIALIKEHHLLGNHLEIGTAAGGTLWEMMRCFPENDRPQFVVVDPMKYFPDQLAAVRENLSEHDINPESVDFRIASSDEAFRQAAAQEESYDFIFIDGNHKIGYVMQDLRWGRLLNVEGLLCLHDFSPNYPGVWTAVNRFLRKYPNYEIIAQSGKLIALKKTAPTSSQEISRWDEIIANILSPIHQIVASIKKRVYNSG